MTAPRVSVLLTTDDVQDVGRTLASVGRQTPSGAVEVVVVDDGASDRALAVVAEWAARTDIPVRVLADTAHLGAGLRLHRGFTACRGAYVAVLRGTDEWTSDDELARRVALLDSRPDLSVVAAGTTGGAVYRAELLERVDAAVYEAPADHLHLVDLAMADLAAAAVPPPAQGGGMVVLDDYFPTTGTGFRIAEFDWLLRHGVVAEVMTTVDDLGSRLAEYAALYPASAGQVSAYDPRRLAGFDCASIMFLNNATRFLHDLERHTLPFVLQLYPGGGLNLESATAQRKLRAVLSSPLLVHVVTTQPNVTALVRELTGGSVPVTEVIGGPVGMSLLAPGAGLRRDYFGSGKEHLDVCFVANRYTADGADKGFPVFLQSMRLLTDAGLPVRGHLVGGFGAEHVGAEFGDLDLTFTATLSTPALREFYLGMDVILSPTTPGLLAPGAFDGFPTGATVEAGLAGVVMVATDPLGLNRLFTDGHDIHLTRADAAEVVARVLGMVAEPDGLRRVAQEGLRTTRRAYGVDAQLTPRRRVLEAALARGRDPEATAPGDPLVSILVPTYNGEKFLRATLRSALGQSYRAIEVIVGDDGSTDGTPQILAAVAASDPRVRVIRHASNVGALENPRRLFAEARGQYVKFLMHDDVLGTDCVRTLVRGMQSSPEVIMAFSHRALIDEEGRRVPGHEFPRLADRPVVLDGPSLGAEVLRTCTNVIGEPTTVLFARADVRPEDLWLVDGRTVDVLNDVQLWLDLLVRGSAYYTPETLSRFRFHPGQNSHNPRYVGRAERDWSRLADWGARHGLLRTEVDERRAQARALLLAATRVTQLIDGPDYGAALEAVHLSTARLVELAAASPVDRSRGLEERAHDRSVLHRFGQELDVWTREYPAALAAPAVEPAAIDDAVRALRDVLAAGVARRAVLTVTPAELERAVPMLEAAMAAGPDFDLDVEPADEPAVLLPEPWLAVAPAGSTWHEGRGLATWTIGTEVEQHAAPPALLTLRGDGFREVLAGLQDRIGDHSALWTALREGDLRRSGLRTGLLGRVDAHFVEDFRRLRASVPAERPLFVGTHGSGVRFLGDARDWPSALHAVDPDTSSILVRSLEEELLRRPGNYVDVGTNIGLVAASIAARLPPGRRVIAFEPSPETLRLAAGTLALNDAENVTLLNAAASDADGSLVFHTTPGNSAIASARRHAFGLLNEWESVTVPAVRLDTLHADGLLDGVTVLKIDVEGHELAVLAGALGFIAAARPTVVYEFTPIAAADHGWTQEDSIALLSRAGEFEFTAVAENDGEVLPFPLPAGYAGQVNVFARPVQHESSGTGASRGSSV